MTYKVELRFQVNSTASKEAVENFIRLFYIDAKPLNSVIPKMRAEKIFLTIEGVEDATNEHKD